MTAGSESTKILEAYSAGVEWVALERLVKEQQGAGLLGKSTTVVAPDEPMDAFRRKLGHLLLLSDLVVVANDVDAAGAKASGYHRDVRSRGGDWNPVVDATDANQYEEHFEIALYNRTAMETCRQLAAQRVPVVYLPTTWKYTFTTWDTRLASEGISSNEMWARAADEGEKAAYEAAISLLDSSTIGELVPAIETKGRHALNVGIPVLDEMDPLEIQRVKEAHPDAYGRFRTELAKICTLAESAMLKGDYKQIRAIQDQYLSDEIVRLNQQYLRIQKSFKESVAAETAMLVTFSLVAMTRHDYSQLLTAAVVFKAGAILKEFVTRREKMRAMEESKLFWFWKALPSRRVPIAELRT